MDSIRSMLPYLVPIIILELGLVVFALLDLSRRRRVNGPKWAWAAAIVMIQFLGPILYLVIGRRDE